MRCKGDNYSVFPLTKLWLLNIAPILLITPKTHWLSYPKFRQCLRMELIMT